MTIVGVKEDGSRLEIFTSRMKGFFQESDEIFLVRGEKGMKRAEQHVIERTHPQFRAIDETGSGIEEPLEPGQLLMSGSRFFFSRNTSTTQQFSMSSSTRRHTQGLPVQKLLNQVLLQLHRAWTAFFEAMEVYLDAFLVLWWACRTCPSTLHKTHGRTRGWSLNAYASGKRICACGKSRLVCSWTHSSATKQSPGIAAAGVRGSCRKPSIITWWMLLIRPRNVERVT